MLKNHKHFHDSPKSSNSSNSMDLECLIRDIQNDRQQRTLVSSPLTDLFDQLLHQNPTHQLTTYQKNSGCKCSKIGCLKLYCDCFNKGQICGPDCSCVGCLNQPGHEQEIEEARMMTNYRHPGYFKGVQAYVPVKRCTCKKSHCIKKYCQCHNSGARCSPRCQCIECYNREMDEEENAGIRYIEIQVRG